MVYSLSFQQPSRRALSSKSTRLSYCSSGSRQPGDSLIVEVDDEPIARPRRRKELALGTRHAIFVTEGVEVSP